MLYFQFLCSFKALHRPKNQKEECLSGVGLLCMDTLSSFMEWADDTGSLPAAYVPVQSSFCSLRVFLMTFIRLCPGAFRTSPVPSFYVESGEPSLSYRRYKLSIQMYTKLMGMTNTPSHDAVAAWIFILIAIADLTPPWVTELENFSRAWPCPFHV